MYSHSFNKTDTGLIDVSKSALFPPTRNSLYDQTKKNSLDSIFFFSGSSESILRAFKSIPITRNHILYSMESIPLHRNISQPIGADS
jgi:hypothetical protein